MIARGSIYVWLIIVIIIIIIVVSIGGIDRLGLNLRLRISFGGGD